MPTDHVFVGPSLPVREVTGLLPDARVHPPVRHGDLLRLRPQAGDRVLVVDGLFLQTAPVRHKEILSLLDQGVVVAGSSSMGALRAAELWPYGMRGIGEVFELYRDLVVVGDDEVAITHCSAEDGYQALSEPLVNLRVTLRAACRDGFLTPDEEQELLRLAHTIPFRSRGPRMLAREAARADVGLADRLLAWYRDHPRDVKAEDARTMLALAAADDPTLAPHGPGDLPIRTTGNRIVAAWSARHGVRDTGGDSISELELITATMLLHPDYPARHRLDVLAGLVQKPWDDPAVPALALAGARERGLSPAASGWLTSGEALRLDADDALLTMLTRSLGTCADQSISAAAGGSLLADPAVPAWAAGVVAEAHRANWMIPTNTSRPDAGRLRFRPEVVDRVFAARWGCDPAELPAAVHDHGIVSMPSFRRLAEPFVAYLKLGESLLMERPTMIHHTPATTVPAGVDR